MHGACGPPKATNARRRGPDAGETQLRALTDAGETRFTRVLAAVFDKLFHGSTVDIYTYESILPLVNQQACHSTVQEVHQRIQTLQSIYIWMFTERGNHYRILLQR